MGTYYKKEAIRLERDILWLGKNVKNNHISKYQRGDLQQLETIEVNISKQIFNFH